jgi:hypothetical protein
MSSLSDSAGHWLEEDGKLEPRENIQAITKHRKDGNAITAKLATIDSNQMSHATKHTMHPYMHRAIL